MKMSIYFSERSRIASAPLHLYERINQPSSLVLWADWSNAVPDGVCKAHLHSQGFGRAFRVVGSHQHVPYIPWKHLNRSSGRLISRRLCVICPSSQRLAVESHFSFFFPSVESASEHQVLRGREVAAQRTEPFEFPISSVYKLIRAPPSEGKGGRDIWNERVGKSSRGDISLRSHSGSLRLLHLLRGMASVVNNSFGPDGL